MSEYIRAIGAAVVLSALMDMLTPEGSFKGYCRLVCGLVVLSAVLSPVTGALAPANFDYPAADMEAARAQARARVLTKHKSNIEEAIEERFPPCEAFVEVDSEGNVVGVTVKNAADEAAVREYIESELGTEGSKIEINENKRASGE